jgi:hypothetical protein
MLVNLSTNREVSYGRCRKYVDKIAFLNEFGIQLVWLPKRAPELHPMDTLWVKARMRFAATSNTPRSDEQAAYFLHHLTSLSDAQAMQTSGIQSRHSWLSQTLLLKKFGAPA